MVKVHIENSINYLKQNQAMDEIKRTDSEIANAKVDGFLDIDVNGNMDFLKNMSVLDRYNEFNAYNDSTRERLSLLGIDTDQEFSDTVEVLKRYDNYESKLGTPEESNALEDIASGTIAGAIVGGIVAVAAGVFTGGTALAAGAAIGAGVGFGTEVAAELTDNEILEGIRNLRRNFQNAVINSTVNMAGKAISTVGNVIDVLAYNIGGEDFYQSITDYNPFTAIGGTIKGIGDFMVQDPTRQYEGITKFLLQDMASVAGSIAGFMALGAAFGAMTGGKAIGVAAEGATAATASASTITAAGKAFNLAKGIAGFSKGTTYAEIATRATVALGEMDEQYEEILAETGDVK